MPSARTVKVVLKGDISDFNRAMLGGVASAKAFGKELDGSTDRMTNMTQGALALGPALVPISAVAIPAISGLTNQLAFAATGAGVAALAFSGVGDALKATNDYAIDPSVTNLNKMNEAMAKLGPAGRDFVTFLQDLRPKLQGLQDIAQGGMFPGIEAGITDLMDLLPNLERIVATVSTTVGDLVAEAGDNLNDARWQEFFTFLETEARPTLLDMGRTLGNFAEGFANLWMAFDPLSDQFSSSFLQMSRDFAAWTDGLDETEGFQEFIAYIAENGPRVWETLGAIGNALLQIVEAAAPVGAAALPVIEALADGIAAIADSDLGPIVIGVVSLTAALSRLKALGTAMNSSAMGGLLGASAYGGAGKAAKDIPGATRAFLQYDAAAARASMSSKDFANSTSRLGASLRGAGKVAGGAGGLAFVMSDLDDKMGLANTAMLGLAGSALGPWGAAIGAGVGLVMDLSAQTDDAAASVKRFQEAFAGQDSLAGQEAVITAMQKQIDVAKEMRDKVQGGPLAEAVNNAVKELEEGLKPLEAQHKASQRAADDQRLAEAGLESAMASASDQTRQETLALLDNIRAKNQAADAASGIFSAETNYRRALKDANEQAKKNNAGIKGSSDAALENREALERLSGAWNKAADAGGKTSAQMKVAKANFIDVAISMGVSAAEAKRLANELFHMPSPKPKVEVKGAPAAIAAAKALKAALDAINPFKQIVINTKHTSTGRGGSGGLARAYGGEILGPGGPRDDLIPVMASNKEIMVNAFDAQEHRDLLLGINAGLFRGKSPQFLANGGEVGRIQRMTSGGRVRDSGPTTVTASLVGAKVGIDKDGFATFVDGRVEVGISQNNNYGGRS